MLEDDNPAKNPWIDLDDMQAHGWIEVSEGHAAPGATNLLLQAHPPTMGCAPGL